MSNGEERRPNVLCFVSDQHRHDHLACAGNPIIQTPNLDRLAASGTRFDRWYVNHPICTPSRATMWTGLSTRSHRMRCNGIHLDTRIPTIGGALSAAGYRTHSVGKIHLTPFSAKMGADPATLNPYEWPECRNMWFTGRIGSVPVPYYGMQSVELVGGHGDFFWGDYHRWLMQEAPQVIDAIEERKRTRGEDWNTTEKSHVPAELHHSHWIADRTIEFLRQQAHTGQPFFCWSSFPDPHHPYHAPDPYFSMYDPADMPPPTLREGELEELPPIYKRLQTERTVVEGVGGPTNRYYDRAAEIKARTYAMVTNMDHNIGRVLDALEELGLRENTLVVYMTDHGDMMGDHWLQQKGPFHFDGLIRIPFIWSWPGHIQEGVVNTGITSMLDFAPTLLDLCGVPIPEGPAPETAESRAQLTVPSAWPGNALRPVLEGQAEALRDVAFIDHDDDRAGFTVRTLVTDRYRFTWYGGQPFGELFDLQEDPQELHNLWNDPGSQSLKRDLAVRLLDEVILTDSRLPRKYAGA